MPDWIKWIIAPKEMAELDRWRVEWNEHRRWLAEFKTVGMALDNLRANAEGKPAAFIFDLREKMRSDLQRQNAALSLIEKRVGLLRAALVGLIGADTKEELLQMESALRILPAPDSDKAVSINAIHALLATLPK